MKLQSASGLETEDLDSADAGALRRRILIVLDETETNKTRAVSLLTTKWKTFFSGCSDR